MKRRIAARVFLLSLLSVCCFSPTLTARALAGEMKFAAQLIWGTNDEPSPDSNLKPVDPELARKLAKLPVKWKHYYVVNSKELTVAQGATHKTAMSKECEIKVKNVDGTSVELQLIGKGKPVGKITKALGKGKCVVTGGDAENYTAWFVFLKQIE
jgi:hypothetical protein